MKDNLKRNYELYILVTLTFSLLLIGTLFYHYHEDQPWIDAYYFCVISLTTVGYGDFEMSDVGKIFTTFYIFIGIGVIVAFVTKLTEYWVEKRERKITERLEKKDPS